MSRRVFAAAAFVLINLAIASLPVSAGWSYKYCSIDGGPGQECCMRCFIFCDDCVLVVN